MKRLRDHVDVWPPIIDQGDIAWEIAIVLVALLAAMFGQAGAIQPLVLTCIVLAVMLATYVWTHVQKR